MTTLNTHSNFISYNLHAMLMSKINKDFQNKSINGEYIILYRESHLNLLKT